MTIKQRSIRKYLEECEAYVNVLSRNSELRSYYVRQREECLKELLQCQIEEFTK